MYWSTRGWIGKIIFPQWGGGHHDTAQYKKMAAVFFRNYFEIWGTKNARKFRTDGQIYINIRIYNSIVYIDHLEVVSTAVEIFWGFIH